MERTIIESDVLWGNKMAFQLNGSFTPFPTDLALCVCKFLKFTFFWMHLHRDKSYSESLNICYQESHE